MVRKKKHPWGSRLLRLRGRARSSADPLCQRGRLLTLFPRWRYATSADQPNVGEAAHAAVCHQAWPRGKPWPSDHAPKYPHDSVEDGVHDLMETCKPTGNSRRNPGTCLHEVEKMRDDGFPVPRETVFSLLQDPLRIRDLSYVKRLHSIISKAGLATVPIFQDRLIRLYGTCGTLLQANEVFSHAAKPTSHTWFSIISSHVKLGRGNMALKSFHEMQQTNAKPRVAHFLIVLKACGMIDSYREGRVLHSQLIECGGSGDLMIGNTLIDMYAKCSLLEDARRVFDLMSNRDIVSWNALISGYTQHHHSHIPIRLFNEMQQESFKPCKMTYPSILKSCSKTGDMSNGKIIHQQIIENAMEADVIVGNALLDMYAKYGMIEEAKKIFDSLPHPTIISWGAIVAGYASQGQMIPALDLFCKMVHSGIQPNHVLFSSILKACNGAEAREYGMLIHDLIIRNRLHADLIIGNTLIDMYIRCGSIEDAYKAFLEMSIHDIVSWNTMISGYVNQGYHVDACLLFARMQQSGLHLEKPLALCMIKACALSGALQTCRVFHELLAETGYDSDIMIQNTLVDMYSKSGSLVDARSIFDRLKTQNLISWGAIISGYVNHGQYDEAFNLFTAMKQAGKTPNDVIYLSLLRLCISTSNLSEGRLIHAQIIRNGFESCLSIGNTLIDMYANCGSSDDGKKVFDALSIRDQVSWGVMIDGYVKNDDCFLALEIFKNMLKEGTEPNRVALLLILKSCGITGSVKLGYIVHHQIMHCCLGTDIESGTTLIDMYSNCGCLEDASAVFNTIPKRDTCSWNAMIAGYSQHGFASLALQSINNMQSEGLKPDSWTFTSLLAACSHEGLVDKGYGTFMKMRDNYKLMPRMEHFNCVVDALSRVGCLNEAEKLLRSMPKLPNSIGWLTLLTACRTFGNDELGRTCYLEAVGLDVDKSPSYLLMSNIYVDACMYGDTID